MPLVNSKEILQDALKTDMQLVPNANNMEIVQAIIETAEERAPVIVRFSRCHKYAGLDMIVAMVKVLAERTLYR